MLLKSLFPYSKNSRYILQQSPLIFSFIRKQDVYSINKCNYTSGNILDLADRGIWQDRFPESCSEFEKSLSSKSAIPYSGFDPTSDSLHIGNLLILIALIHFQRKGHKVIALVGGATARIGDPSGKNEERPILTIEEIERNTEKIKENIGQIFSNHEKFIWKPLHNKLLQPVEIVDNYTWYKNINTIDFLRNIGKHLKMGMLLRRASIQERLQQNKTLSFTEFSYQVMQAYDWLHLFRHYNCNVQVGGSDQMGNILIGHELISREEASSVTGLTLPLITSEIGDKLGKSAGTSVWLSPDKMSPYEFYQFFVRIKDSEVEHFLKVLTFLPMHEIEETMTLHKLNPEKLMPQKKLAKHLTLLVHGEEGLLKSQRATNLIFGGDSTVLADMAAEEILELFKGSTVRSLHLKPGISVLDLAIEAGCFASERRAAQVIEVGGFYINEAKVTNPLLLLIHGVHILPNGISLVRVGKRNYYIIEWKS